MNLVEIQQEKGKKKSSRVSLEIKDDRSKVKKLKMHEEDLNAQENKGGKKYYRFPKAKSTLAKV